MHFDLRGKTVFIAGSTGGIGRAVAEKLAEMGADIVLNGRNAESAEEVMENIKKKGVKVIFEKADIREYGEVKQAVENALDKLGKIDILVASGGASGKDFAPSFFHETDPADYPIYAKAQWWSRLYCVKALLSHMRERKAGKIIILTTDAGRWPTPAESVVGGAGAAVAMATKVLAQELARWQIRVNAVSTTIIENSVSYEFVTESSPSLAHVFKKAVAKQPFPVTIDDVANACSFFASSASDGITGQILSVNGGLCFP